MFTFVYDLLLLFYYVNFFIKLFYVKETLCTVFIEEKKQLSFCYRKISINEICGRYLAVNFFAEM